MAVARAWRGGGSMAACGDGSPGASGRSRRRRDLIEIRHIIACPSLKGPRFVLLRWCVATQAAPVSVRQGYAKCPRRSARPPRRPNRWPVPLLDGRTLTMTATGIRRGRLPLPRLLLTASSPRPMPPCSKASRVSTSHQVGRPSNPQHFRATLSVEERYPARRPSGGRLSPIFSPCGWEGRTEAVAERSWSKRVPDQNYPQTVCPSAPRPTRALLLGLNKMRRTVESPTPRMRGPCARCIFVSVED